MSTCCKHSDSWKVAENVQNEELRVLFVIPENNIKENHSHADLMLGSLLCIIPWKPGIQVAVIMLLFSDVFCSVWGDFQVTRCHSVSGVLLYIRCNSWEYKCPGEEPLSVVCCTFSVPGHHNKPWGSRQVVSDRTDLKLLHLPLDKQTISHQSCGSVHSGKVYSTLLSWNLLIHCYYLTLYVNDYIEDRLPPNCNFIVILVTK